MGLRVIVWCHLLGEPLIWASVNSQNQDFAWQRCIKNILFLFLGLWEVLVSQFHHSIYDGKYKSIGIICAEEPRLAIKLSRSSCSTLVGASVSKFFQNPAIM